MNRFLATVRGTLAGRVISNLLPVVFVLISSWDARQQVLVYWIETVIIVFVGMMRIGITAQRAGEDNPRLLTLMISGQLLGYTVLSWFLLAITFQLPLIPTLDGLAYSGLFLTPSMVIAVLAYLATHVHSFVVHFLPLKSRTKADVTAEYARPYIRVITGATIIMVIGFLYERFGDPRIALVGLALLKTAMEAQSHAVTHKLRGP